MKVEAQFHQYAIAGVGAVVVGGIMALIGSHVKGFWADLIFVFLILLFAVLAVSVKFEKKDSKQGGQA